MKNHNNKVWAGVEQLNDDAAFAEAMERKEFFELPVVEQLSQDKALDLSSNRRDFLKYLGFGLGGATVAASCDIPVKRAIPYVVKPDTIVPGVATYYASSFVQGGDYCSILVKTREGRPIKVEGNSMSKVTMGGTSARTQASVLSLYDTNRIPSAQKKGADGWGKISWDSADKEIAGKLTAGAQIRIVSNTILSPTTKKVLGEFKAKFPNTKVVTYDPVSSSAILQANQQSFGKQAIPEYRFDNAKVIVSFNADFLGTWISPIEYAAQYITNRKIKDTKNPQMSRHVQVESHMSLTGSNADNRILVRPSEQGAAIVTLYNEIVGGSGGPKVNDKAAAGLKKVAAELKANRGASLVVSGSNNVGEQILVNAINNALGNYGKTINWDVVSNQRQGIDKDIQDLIVEMKSGGVDAVLVMDNANPAWDLPNSADFVAGFAKVGTKVSFAGLPNETGDLCDYKTPTNHYLESWGDAEPKSGHLSLIQPTISPIFKTRQAEVSLLKWAGSANLDMSADQPYFDYLKKAWQATAFTQQNNFATFNAFWDSALHDGVFHSKGRKVNLITPAEDVVSAEGETVIAPIGVAAGTFNGNVNTALSQVSKPSNAGVEVSFYETVNMGAGQYANNPWLQEMPDPVMRTVWGNYISVPIGWDGDKFTAMNDLNPNELYGEANKVNVTVNGSEKEMTAVRQFGQMQNTVAIALGNGRKVVGLSGKNVGVNINPWLSIDANGNTQYYSAAVTVSESIGVDDFACVQYHDTMGVKGKDTDGTTINVDEKALATVGTGYQGALTNRSIIFQANLKELGTFTHDLVEKREEFATLNSHTLYQGYDYKYDQGHHWGMYIDLNACIGCGACQVACIAENNVPVVGKNEVFRHHEMTWLRIDRYFFGDYENPNVVYQPMMCQHCDNAPCENVCPVAATNHSSEGLNQMTYNRCIGTRYCANNCPYKVRRFNWLDYSTADIFPANEYTINGEDVPYGADNLTRMVLNPDVTVRSRGVIEKCSFCVQRIQEGKLTAKKELRGLRDGEVKTACQTACPTGAIIFGDTNNKKSAVAQNIASPLNFRVIEETNTDSSVYYSSKIVNRDESIS